MYDILEQIVSAKSADYERMGPTFGANVPMHRTRPVVPFLETPGTILEIKRASPSRGDIATNLDPIETANQYRLAGTRNLSVLTEQRFFKGSLEDLTAIASEILDLSILRKDFILYDDEIEVSYRAGADAVLLIARILDTDTLLRLAKRCRTFSMTPLIEVRDAGDLKKLSAAAAQGYVIAGVNSRDLATFKTDPLVPAILRSKLPCKTIFESGVTTPGACRFARQLGFDGLLIGEAVAKNPKDAAAFVHAFDLARPDWLGHFWREIGKRIQDNHGRNRPIVKICGLTNEEDARYVVSLGADILGFIFSKSPRAVSAEKVREIALRIQKTTGRNNQRHPLLVGVVTETNSETALEAFSLVCEGILDAIQYHGETPEQDMPCIDRAGGCFGIGKYSVVRLGSDEDIVRIDALIANGEPRVLIDARVEGIAGGTGQTIPKSLVQKAAERCGLWLAGGITPKNIRQYLEQFSPELVDVSSGLEFSPGKKDKILVASFFREISR